MSSKIVAIRSAANRLRHPNGRRSSDGRSGFASAAVRRRSGHDRDASASVPGIDAPCRVRRQIGLGLARRFVSEPESALTEVLIGEQHVVEIFRDDEFFVLEIRDPGSAARCGIDQSRHDLAETDAQATRAGFAEHVGGQAVMQTGVNHRQSLALEVRRIVTLSGIGSPARAT